MRASALRHARAPRPWLLRRLNHTSANDETSPQRRSIRSFLEWKPEEAARHVVVDGWVRSVRDMKKRAFVALGDGSTLAPLQAVVPGGHLQGYVSLSCLAHFFFF